MPTSRQNRDDAIAAALPPTHLLRRAAIRVGGSAVALGLLFWTIPFRDFKDHLQGIPAYVWPLALVSYLLIHAIGVAKWRLLINAAGAALSFGQVMRAYYWGLFANTILPSILGGDVIRVAVVLRAARSKSGLILGSVVDRLLDVIGMAAIAGIGAALSPQALDARSRQIFLGLGALVALAGLATLASLSMIPVRRLPFKLRRRLVHIRRAYLATAARPGTLVAALFIGLLLQSVQIVLNYWLGLMVGVDAPLYVWFFVWPLAKLAGMVSPTLGGGVGVREGVQIILFAPFGISKAAALAAGLAFEAIIISGGLLAGLLSYWLGRRDQRDAQIRSRRAVIA